MTREEAITKTFKKYDIPTSNPFFFEILKAIEQESSENAISRSDMLDAIGHGTTYTSEELQKIIKALPPVNPQAKTGHWISFGVQGEIDGQIVQTFTCSECSAISIFRLASGNIVNGALCPNCGAKMSEIPTGSESEE